MAGIDVELRGATVSGEGGRPRLDALSLRVAAGETLVLLGRSGSGKTTALKLVNALLRPSAGDVLVDSRSTSEWDAVQLRRRIGYVIQEGGLFPHLDVERNVGIVPELEGWDRPRIVARVRELLEMVSLAPDRFAHRMPHELSGGERQRVGVARALAADPPIVLMDEPFGALDPPTREEVRDEFCALRDRLGKTIFFVTHDLREAVKLGGRIALLAAGRLRFLGTAADLLRDPGDESRAFARTLQATPGV